MLVTSLCLQTQKILQHQIQEQMMTGHNFAVLEVSDCIAYSPTVECQRYVHRCATEAADVQFPSAPGVVNMSHVIRALNFGKAFPGQVNPLDGKSHLIN